MASASPLRLSVKHFGPIRDANVTFGDLNVIVGPQATGKSLFFQLLNLLTDPEPICRTILQSGTDWGSELRDFLHVYFGTPSLCTAETVIEWKGKKIDLAKLIGKAKRDARKVAPGERASERMFYIPAQRVMAVRDGITRPFGDFYAGDPYVLRKFSDALHSLVQSGLIRTDSDTLFPMSNKLNPALRPLVSDAFFHGFDLKVARGDSFTKRLELTRGDTRLPFMTWSAGQREFTPLLLGLYWLLPSGGTSLRGEIESIVIEEPEMGLHPKAIQAFMAIVLELLRRGYRVFLSTHSPAVLDVLWGLQTVKKNHGSPDDILDMLGLKASAREMAARAIEKSITVHSFEPESEVRDISGLDPGAESGAESGWGGLTSFTGQIGDVVARVVNQHETRGAIQ